MKTSKIIVSLVLVIILVSFNIIPAFAESNMALIEGEKISSLLSNIMDSTDDNDYIPVYIWYQDINQNSVDELTYRKTGLTPEKCDILSKPDFIESDLENALSDDNSINEYFEKIAPLREKENELTDTYIKARRRIALEKYNEKSESIISDLSIDSDKILFRSEFAPMIIAHLTKAEIINIAKNSSIESLSLYSEIAINDCSLPFGKVEPSVAHESIGLDESFYNKYNIDGSGVKIGLLEGNAPGIMNSDTYTYSNYGFDSDNLLTVCYDQFNDFNDIQQIVDDAISDFPDQESLRVVTIAENGNYEYLEPDPHYNWGDPPETVNLHGHANNSIHAMVGEDCGIAKGARVYATIQGKGKLTDNLYIKYANVETLVNCGINVLEVNFYYSIKDTDSEDDINTYSKYNEHLVSCHGVSVVVAGYNACSDAFYGDWINAAGLAYNVITVGGFKVSVNPNTGEFTYTRNAYRWANSNDSTQLYVCEKPDVIMPSNYLDGGTSTASPSLTALIALMMQLKPSLKLQPATVKAIILASCQKKALSSSSNEPLETMTTGIPSREAVNSSSSISECQGAGIPNAGIIAQIICQHTYGSGVLKENTDIRVTQPPYDATNMNISISWLKNVNAINNHVNGNDYTDGTIENLCLEVYNGNSLVACSDLNKSSTEMCYIPIQNDFEYRFHISSVNQNEVDYGYAWSTNSSYETFNSDSGIYYFRNASDYGVQYLKNDVTAQYSHYQAQVVNPLANTITDDFSWIFRNTSIQNCSLETGYGINPQYINISNISYPNSSYLYSDLNNTEFTMKYRYNYDGSISIFNNDYSKILSSVDNAVVWSNYIDNQQIDGSKKWILDKQNYYVYDANANGSIDQSDIYFIQIALAYMVTPSNIQTFLGDVNCDGSLDVIDATLLSRYLDYELISNS